MDSDASRTLGRKEIGDGAAFVDIFTMSSIDFTKSGVADWENVKYAAGVEFYVTRT